MRVREFRIDQVYGRGIIICEIRWFGSLQDITMPVNKNLLMILSVMTIAFSILVAFRVLTSNIDIFHLRGRECDRCFSTEDMDMRLSINEPTNLPIFLHNPHIIGLVLARGGSKGIRKKNLAKIGNDTLLGRTLKTLKSFGRFSSIWVSTDAEDIALEAVSHGVQVHWRSKESATDAAPSILGAQDFLLKHPEADIIGLVQCTSPFLTKTFLSDGYDLVYRKNYDSVFSVTRKFELHWKIARSGNLIPVNFNPFKRPRRQDWSGELVENGMFYFARVHLIHHGVLQGGK